MCICRKAYAENHSNGVWKYMIWKKFTIETTVEAEDLVAEYLEELGFPGAEIEDQLPLTEEEMQLLKGADRNCRLVKGQVFLWPGADDWTQLWE